MALYKSIIIIIIKMMKAEWQWTDSSKYRLRRLEFFKELLGFSNY